MDSQPDANPVSQDHMTLKQPGYLRVAWLLLLLLGAFFLFASISDLAADGRSGLPSDHLEAFQTIAGVSWTGLPGRRRKKLVRALPPAPVVPKRS